jgi:hypothetical protein
MKDDKTLLMLFRVLWIMQRRVNMQQQTDIERQEEAHKRVVAKQELRSLGARFSVTSDGDVVIEPRHLLSLIKQGGRR